MITKTRVCDPHKEDVIARRIYIHQRDAMYSDSQMRGYLNPDQVRSVANSKDCQICSHPAKFRKVERIATGIKEVDEVLKGGLPPGRISEVWGRKE